MTDFTFLGLGLLALLTIGVLIFGGIALVGRSFFGISPKGQKTAAMLTFVLIIGAVFVGGGFGTLGAPAVTATQAQFTVTPSLEVAQSQVVLDDSTNTVQVNLQYDISDGNFIGGTGFAEVNFTVGRADTSTADITTTTDILTIAQVPKSDGSGTTYPVVSKNADGTFKWNVEKGPNAAPTVTIKSGTLLIPGGGTNFLRLNITFNPTAAAEQTVYQSTKSTFTVAGETWTCLAVLVVKQA